MHISRILALIGVIVGAVGLFLKALTSEGESVMEALSESVRELPSGIPTIWGALDTWEQIAVVVAGLVVLLLVFQPPRRSAFGASAATIVTVIGGALTAYAVIKWLDAGDNADRIEAAFQQVADAGQIPEAFDVTTGPGFIVVIAGSFLHVHRRSARLPSGRRDRPDRRGGVAGHRGDAGRLRRAAGLDPVRTACPPHGRRCARRSPARRSPQVRGR